MAEAFVMKRFLLGDDSRFVESALGRLTLCVLFTTLVGLGLTLLFVLPTGFSPFLLKFVVIIGVGLAASFITRRLLGQRSAALRAVGALFASLIALGVLSPLTQGFIGLNLLHPYAIATPLDAAIQLVVVGLAAWAGQVAWARQRTTVLVEPRQPREALELTRTAAPPPAPRPAARVRTRAAAQPGRWQRLVSRLLPPAAPTRKLRSVKPARTRAARGAARGNGITLSAQEQHVCPYCLEPVTKRDPRGVKICKICKTWHHADCWEITGVCQVPHAYQN